MDTLDSATIADVDSRTQPVVIEAVDKKRRARAISGDVSHLHMNNLIAGGDIYDDTLP